MEDGKQLLRLYPIRYRRLEKENQFDRFDLVEMEIWRATDDFRPESHKVVEGSIRVLRKGDKLSARDRVKIWKPFIAPSLAALRDDNRATHRSLGIVRPDPGSVEFIWRKAKESSEEDRQIAEAAYQQESLFEDPLKKLSRPEYAFYYRFTSDGQPFNGQIHDWEVQAAYFNYEKKYGTNALEKLKQKYQEDFPKQNLHIIMGTMKAVPTKFIIIGLLRSTEDPKTLDMQSEFGF